MYRTACRCRCWSAFIWFGVQRGYYMGDSQMSFIHYAIQFRELIQRGANFAMRIDQG